MAAILEEEKKTVHGTADFEQIAIISHNLIMWTCAHSYGLKYIPALLCFFSYPLSFSELLTSRDVGTEPPLPPQPSTLQRESAGEVEVFVSYCLLLDANNDRVENDIFIYFW